MKNPPLAISLPGQQLAMDDQHEANAKVEKGISVVVIESKPLPTLPAEPKTNHRSSCGMRPRKASIFIEHCHEDDQTVPDSTLTHIEHRLPRDKSWPLSRHAEAGLGTYRLSPPAHDLHDICASSQEHIGSTPPELTIPSPVHHPLRDDLPSSTKKRRRLSKPRGGVGCSLSGLLQASVRQSTAEVHHQSEHTAEDEPWGTSLGYHVSQAPELPSATSNAKAASLNSFSPQLRGDRQQPTSTANVLLDIRSASRLGNRTSLNVHLPDALSPLRLPEMEADLGKKKTERTSARIFTNPFPARFSRNQDGPQETTTASSHDADQRGSRQWSTTGCVRCATEKLKQFCVSEIRVFLPVLAGLLLAWTCLWCAITFMATELSQHGHNHRFTPAIIWFSTSLVGCVILTSILSCLVTRREVMARRDQAYLRNDEESGTGQPPPGNPDSIANLTTRQRSATQPVPFEFDPANGIRAFLDSSDGGKKLSDASSEAVSPSIGRRHHVTLSRVLSAGVRKPPAWEGMTHYSTKDPRRDHFILDDSALRAVAVQDEDEKAKSDRAWWEVSKDSNRLRRYIEHLEAQYEIVRQHRSHNNPPRTPSFDDSETRDVDPTELSAVGLQAQNALRLSAIGLAYSTPTFEEGLSEQHIHFEPSELINDESLVSARQYPISKHAASASSCSSIRTVSYASQSSTTNSNPFNLYTVDNVTSVGMQHYVSDEPLFRSRISTVDDLPHPYAAEQNHVFGLEQTDAHAPTLGHPRGFSEEDTTMEMQILSAAAVQHAPYDGMYSPLHGGCMPASRTTATASCSHCSSAETTDHEFLPDDERTPTASKVPRFDYFQDAAASPHHHSKAGPHTPLHRIVTEAGTPLEQMSAERRPSCADSN